LLGQQSTIEWPWGRRQIRDAAQLAARVSQVLEQHAVTGLLHVAWRQEEEGAVAEGGRRSSAKDPRYVITEVRRDETAIAARQHHLGWRALATSMPAERMSLPECVLHYRQGWCLERDFHLMKARPFGMSPILVHREEQIVGKTYLLTLALRLMTLMETQVRRVIADTDKALPDLYAGTPTRLEARPTAARLLQAFARAEITLTHVQWGDKGIWHVTPLTPTLERVLNYLGISSAVYARLAGDTS